MKPYDLLQLIDGKTRLVRDVARGQSHDVPITDVRISPAGNRVCFREQGMRCLELSTGDAKPMAKPNGDPYSMVWDERGERFLSTGAGELIWVDIRAHQAQTIGLREDVRYWGFVPGANAVYAYDKGAWIVDLGSGEAIQLAPKTVEVSAVVFSPKGGKVLMATQAGAQAHYALVEVTPSL